MEDVEVLQKELVQVQTLMDSMTREREEESERLKNHYEQLQADYTTSEVRGTKHVMSGRSNMVELILTSTFSLMCRNISRHPKRLLKFLFKSSHEITCETVLMYCSYVIPDGFVPNSY